MTPAELKEFRQTAKLTQAEAATMLYMTRQHYNLMESGKEPITLLTAWCVNKGIFNIGK